MTPEQIRIALRSKIMEAFKLSRGDGDTIEISTAHLLGLAIAAQLYRETLPNISILDIPIDEACRLMDEKYPGLSKFVKGK